MRIIFDPQIFTSQYLGGISRCFTNLMWGLDAIGQEPICPIPAHYAGRNANIYLTEIQKFIPPHPPLCRIAGRALSGLTIKFRKRYTGLLSHLYQQAQRSDVAHAGQYLRLPGFILKHPHLVTTVHDMIPEVKDFRTGEPCTHTTLYSKNKRAFVERSEKIIAISEFTKQELIRLWGVDSDRIHVVHHSNPFENVSVPEKESHQPYMLYVGNRGGYKNFQRFIAAAAPILHEEKDLRIICTGAAPFTPKELSSFEHLGISGRVSTSRVSDKDLLRLYTNASLFCFPSCAEGFGLPILEAFHCHCPICCADATCFPEIAGKAACYFDPYSVDSQTTALRRVLYDSDFRTALIANGDSRIQKFTQQSTAEQTLEVYQACMG